MRNVVRLAVLGAAAVAIPLAPVQASDTVDVPPVPDTATGTLVETVTDDFGDAASESGLGVVPDGDPTGFVPLEGVEVEELDHLVGERVRASGEGGGEALEVDGADVEALGGTPTAAAAPTGAGTAAAPLAYSLLAITVEFSDSSRSSVDPASLSARLFDGPTSVAAYYADSSDDQWSLSGEVAGTYTISRGGSSCNYDGWGQAAMAKAEAAGYDLDDYTNVMVVWPDSGCGWAGLGQVPGVLTWINSSNPSVFLLAHELGHNFGAHHASTLTCYDASGKRQALTDDCYVQSEYGDPFSVMGGGSRGADRLHHTSSRAVFGLVTPTTLTKGKAAQVTLGPADTPSGIREVRVPRGDGTWIALEYRRPTGVFDDFSSTDPVVTGVTLRVDLGKTSRGRDQNTWLIDTHPSTSTYSDAPLQVGETFSDPLTRARITLESRTSTKAVVKVSWPKSTVDLPPWVDTVSRSEVWIPSTRLVTG